MRNRQLPTAAADRAAITPYLCTPKRGAFHGDCREMNGVRCVRSSMVYSCPVPQAGLCMPGGTLPEPRGFLLAIAPVLVAEPKRM